MLGEAFRDLAEEAGREISLTIAGRENGTGLELSIAHSIVKKHGGRITAASHVGTGTRIDVFLPATEMSAGDGEQTAERGPVSG